MKKPLIYLLLTMLTVYSCKKETGVAGPAGAAGINGSNGNLLDTGTLSGQLSVYDEFSWPMKDSGGVRVSLKSGETIYADTTDASGNYTFHGLPSGTYDLTYEKSGFGTMKYFGVPHSPGTLLPTTVPEIYILQNPRKTAVDSLSYTDGYSYIILNIYLDTSSQSYNQYFGNFILLIGKNASISTDNASLSPYYQYIMPQTDGRYTIVLDKSMLGGINHQGGTYYVSVGTYNRWVHKSKNPGALFDTGVFSSYVNPDNGQYVYPNLKLSPNKITVP